MSISSHPWVELALSALLTLIGIATTTSAVLAHVAILVAPGALVITAGGTWLGNAMARHHVRLIPSPIDGAQEGDG
ncbi:MAG TPA: hypothetical protein VHX16_20355 [Chloroflexota bacterium]|nr:hypothetical protein [Chloroflexota bacterium]